MEKYILLFLIIFLILNFSYEQVSPYRIYPEAYKLRDIIYPENDMVQNYDFSLIEAKVLTKEEITLYIKKQGIHLDYDNCCKNFQNINLWPYMEDVSDLEEIYSNAKYNTVENKLTYKFPINKIENKGYSVYHKLWVIFPNEALINYILSIDLNYVDNTLGDSGKINLFNRVINNIRKLFIIIEIICYSDVINTDPPHNIIYPNDVIISVYKPDNTLLIPTSGRMRLEGEISSITYTYPDLSYSPAIALHWTYYKIVIAISNLSLKGNSLCDRVTNPCISGYYCIGGVCKKCHPSCFDCVNGGLSTDCSTKCNTHSILMVPDKGSCNLGYVDLNQFEDFDIEDIVPPPRNNRLTISFWMFLSHFPENEVTASLTNNFNDLININLKFTTLIENTLRPPDKETSQLIISCADLEGNPPLDKNALNNWFFVKCAISFDHDADKKKYLYIKYFNNIEYVYFSDYKASNGNECGHDFKKYYEPDDYITLHFFDFSKLRHDRYACNAYMKQLVLFREFLPEPYDNKYFSVEKLLTSTLELPEILFIIPFDELKKESNKYKIKSYSYAGNIEENEIILSPRESGDKFSLYPPKLFKRLNLLEKNKKYSSRDLLKIDDISLDLTPNTLIASYEKVPISCIDNYFLNYDTASNDPESYGGECNPDCPIGYSMIFGLGDRKGFCNKNCNLGDNDREVCLNKGMNLTLLQKYFKCEDTGNYYNMFYKCENINLDEQKRNIFYFDPHYYPANIFLDVRNYNLKSYIIEFWFHYSDCGRIKSGYIFYTNQIQIRKVETSYNVYTTSHDVRNSITIYEGQWNHIVLEVYYDPREKRNEKTKVYVQTGLNTGNPLEIDNSENAYPLEYIYFCNGRRSTCNNLELDWFCSYYKNLRLFNGVLAQRHITFRYDEYYGEKEYLLLSSIVLYYPLFGQYIANNILDQYQQKLAFFTTTSPTNTWNFPQYNYCIKDDHDCDGETNCKYCFDVKKCYNCAAGFLSRKKGGEENICETSTNDYYVLKLPFKNEIDFEIDFRRHIYDEGYKYQGITVNFFIKLYGFSTTEKIDIIYLGDNLKISYNSNFDDLYFGLNLVSFSGTSENVISNYYDFRKHFGLWTFISVATYNKTNDNFFPPMVRFEINHKKMTIVGPLDYLNIEKISFSKKIYALIQKVKVYKSYIIGSQAYETVEGDTDNVNNKINNYKILDPSSTYQSYFEPVRNENLCLFSNFGLSTLGKYDCVPDYDDELLKKDIVKEKYFHFINESRLSNNPDLCDEKCDICHEGSRFDCSCNFRNENKKSEKIFLGNISNHFCQNFDYFNFARAIAEVNIGPINFDLGEDKKFTLHFWVFSYSYIEYVFKGFEVIWENYITIRVEIDTTKKYNFKCVINGVEANKIIDFNMNKWNFLHCAFNVDIRKLYMTTEEDSFEIEWSINPSMPGSSKLTIKDLTEVDWGVLFFKHIRLWKDAFHYSSFLSRIGIPSSSRYFKRELLYQFNTEFNNKYFAWETRYDNNEDKALEIIYDEHKIGTNIVPEEIYQEVVDEPIVCYEEGQYFDRKTQKCIDFVDISNINSDIIIENVDVAYSHNYGIAFWILLEDQKSIIKPLNFIWQYHMQISLKYTSIGTDYALRAYCFPQNYKPYSDILESELSLEEKSEQVLNYINNTYDEDKSGVWTWIQCSLTYNNRYFYLNENQRELKAEILYKYMNESKEVEEKIENDEPLGYFYNAIKETKSTLKIEITNPDENENDHRKIYLRCFYLFKDYLPYNYNFKYMDMYRIDKEEFPPLTFAINFANFKLDKAQNGQIIITFDYRKYSSLENLITPEKFTKTIDNVTELSSNFVFLPLCNPLTNEKYNLEKQLCKEIDDCDKIALNCLYCMEEKKPLVCKTHYYINIDTEKDQVECLNYCKGNYYRSPGTFPTQGICGTDCITFDKLLTCPNTAASILTYQNDFTCLTGYRRIGYQCFNEIEEKNPGALFYSGYNYPYNIYQSFTNDFISLIGNGYILEFWFMIDHVIYDSNKFESQKNYHYFYAKPHEIYVIKDASNNLNYYYKFTAESKPPLDLTELLHRYEWNKILIFVDATISGKKEIRVIVNFYFNKEILEKNHTINVTTGDMTLTYIAFCSNDPNTKGDFIYPECVSRNREIRWASAYYNNIRIWNIVTANIDTIQSYINGIYTEYPQSLLLFYPLTIRYLDNNVMTNIMGNLEEHISFKCPNGARCTLYNKDNIIIYNYSSKFDWGLTHKQYFVNEMDGKEIKPKKCHGNCSRCYKENDKENCYECEEGFVLKYKECKNAKKYYFLKTPTETVGASINLVLENEDGNSFTDLKSFTIVFWMKFYGVEYPTVTEYCKILSLDSNTYLAFHRTTNDLVLLENSKIVFRDINFKKYFGMWIPIAIANYISNAQYEIYPNMFTLSVNRKDIPFSEGYSLPSTGIKVSQLQLGYEIISLFAELKIYSKFIQGAYGRITAKNYTLDLFYSKSLIGNSNTTCISDSDLISPIPIFCSPDYSIHFMRGDEDHPDYFSCKNDDNYFSPYNEEREELPNEEKCGDCDKVCNTLCFNGGNEECTCDTRDGIYWLKRNEKLETYCEQIPYQDFSNLKPYTYTNAPLSKTKEYTIEFWFFVYSYNTVTMNFRTFWIEWNYHNRLKLYNEQNSLKVDCQPIWRSHDFDIVSYPDNRQASLKYYQWNYVKCGTDLKNKKYFLNTITEYALKTKEEFFFDLKEIDETASEDLKYFSIYRGDDFLDNFGYIFIRELKLWQQYNLDFLDLKYIEFDLEKTSVDELKKEFPGLLLYYKNEFNLTNDGNPIITEILTNKNETLGRVPDYVGYNIVDPDNKGYAPLLKICPYGQIYDELWDGKCRCADKNNSVPSENGTCSSPNICKFFSNKEEQCLTCKEENIFLNKWLNEFDKKCYQICEPTTYGDTLMNQCRRCHETCYTCVGDQYNNCTSCTGELYLNNNTKTCIPNCEADHLTASLTKKNLCVDFDADASLVNVNTLTPIDVNNFDYIEAIVIQPTSSNYKTLWLFDANQTNSINSGLGFEDEIPLDSHPFTGDRTKLRVDLDHNFFKTKHKYVFGLKIYVENEGKEVPIFVWWTLTMNAPPYGGQLTVMPYLGLYNTTTFIMRCIDFLDENTPSEDFEYDFYYIEVNTNSKIKLSKDFSLNNEVYSNFTVRYYQLEYSNITIYCQVRDKFGAIAEASNVITIVNQKNSPLYNLKQIVASFYIVDDALTDIQLLARSEVLMSLGINPFTERVPSSYFTTYEASLTGEKVEKKDPYCVTGYCNDNGECEVIDVALTCKCIASYIGKECYMEKDGYTDLAYYYKKLYQRLVDRLIIGNVAGEPINEFVFNAFYKLFFAAQNFFQEDSFFETNLIEFKMYLKEEVNYITANEDKINKILDLDEFFYNYFYIKENQIKLSNKINENYPFRNKTLTLAEFSTYKTAFQKLFDQIDEDTIFIIQKYGKDYDYTSQHFIYHLKKIDQTFDDESYFESLKTVYVTYKPVILFMNCLRQKNPNFIYFFNYVEYLVNPLSYEATYYPNVTSPLISIKIYDQRGNEIPIRNCPSEVPIKIYLPFNSYDWMNYINEQKWLFLPENYKLENDPIFRDPIFIWDNGTISSETAQQRIEKYYRYYNIVGLVHTPTTISLYEYSTFIFKNISDTFLLMFETNHLSAFSSMIIPNIMNFVVDGRFYYLPRYKVLFRFENHIHNPAFYIWASLLFLFIFISLFYYFYDYNYFDRLEELEFLQKEIIKVHFPYKQMDPGLNDEKIFNLIPKESKLKKMEKRPIKKMFKGYDMDDIKENEENEESENDNYIDLFGNGKNTIKDNLKTNISNFKEKPATRRELMTRNETKPNDDEELKEKATEIRTHKKDKNNSKRIKNDKNQKNPPKKHKTYIDDDNGDDKDNHDNYKYTLKDDFNHRNKEISKEQKEDSFDLRNINKTFSKISKSKKSEKKEKKEEEEDYVEEDEKEEKIFKGYGDDDNVDDFSDKKIEDFIKSEKNTIKTYSKGSKQNFDLQALDSKVGFNNSKLSKNSHRSRKKYFIDNDKIKANYISLQRFHNRAGRLNVDNDGIPLDIINEEEERKKALDAFTKLSVTPFEFFKYNLKARHILVAPFLNLTLFNNRWKKLMVLLTQFYIQQTIISLILTYKETIILSNGFGLIVTSLIASIISDILVYCFVFLFSASTYQRKRLYRLVMLGEKLIVDKAWERLKKSRKCSFFFGFIIAMAFWFTNFYITLIFTAVWNFQRSTWIACFVLTLFFDLFIGECLIEGFCAYCFSKRVISDFYKKLGESLNRLRCYRTLWP